MGVLDLIFPKNCFECGSPGKYICRNCLEKVRLSYKSNSLWSYEGVIRKAILALKYKFAFSVAEELAEVCVREIKQKKFSKNITLVPIPLHAKRKNWRGFNQSEEVGKLIANKMGWKFISNLLVRGVDTKPQVGIRGEERRANVKGIFLLNPKYKISKKSKILIFDDVTTTGSTMSEAVKTLKEAGFGRVRTLAVVA